MGIATIDVLLMHCLKWTSHVSVHANLKVPNNCRRQPGIVSKENINYNVSDFILWEMDGGKVTAMILYDLSSSVNHTVLVNTLLSLGVKLRSSPGMVSIIHVMPFPSCLDKQLLFRFCTTYMRSSARLCGRGPTMFSLYLTGLKNIFHLHSLSRHVFADDIQILLLSNPIRAMQPALSITLRLVYKMFIIG